MSHNLQWEYLHGIPKSLAIVSTQVSLQWDFSYDDTVQRSGFTQIARGIPRSVMQGIRYDVNVHDMVIRDEWCSPSQTEATIPAKTQEGGGQPHLPPHSS